MLAISLTTRSFHNGERGRVVKWLATHAVKKESIEIRAYGKEHLTVPNTSERKPGLQSLCAGLRCRKPDRIDAYRLLLCPL